MKIMITGANGQLGRELLRQLAAGGSSLGPVPERLTLASVIPVDFEDADITNLHATGALLRHHAPDVLIHCAAFTNVDKCETEKDAAFAVNAVGTRNIAIACEAVGAVMLHISTDYVFSGAGPREPLPEYTPTGPRSIYGQTKLLAETYVRALCPRSFIVRTAWLYGRDGANFAKTILRAGLQGGPLKVVNDQFGTPTNAEDLAHHLLRLLITRQYGLYHCTGNGTPCTWYDFAREILQLANVDVEINPCTTEEYPRPAPRPAYSALDNMMLRATIGDEMRPWPVALKRFFIGRTLEEILE